MSPGSLFKEMEAAEPMGRLRPIGDRRTGSLQVKQILRIDPRLCQNPEKVSFSENQNMSF